MSKSREPVRINVPADDAEQVLGRLFPDRRIKRVLLVHPPDADRSLFRADTARRGRYSNYPPYGLMLIAQNLRAAGVDAAITGLNHEVLKRCMETSAPEAFDFDAAWQQKLDSDIEAFDPDMIGVSCMFTMTHLSFKAVCQHAAKWKRPIAIGGVHVTNDLKRVVEDIKVADIAFTNESDLAIKTFVRVVNGEESAAALGQVTLIDHQADGTSRLLPALAGQRPESGEFNLLPAYDLIDLKRYSQVGTIGSFYFLKPQGTRFATILSNRGCRAQCTFCSVRNFNGKGVRTRPVRSVVDEIEALRNEHGIDHLMWLDDDLFYNDRRTLELLNEIVRRNLGITWDASNGIIAASCTEELVAAAAASGCIGLTIGMESGNSQILRQIKKPANVDVLLRAAEVLRRYESIHASVFLMIGFPNETMRMIQDTIQVSREMDLDWYKISQLQPLPNTPIFESMLAQGLVRQRDTQEVRYMAGGYGKLTEVERSARPETLDFAEAFSSIALDEVPTPEQLTDVWFFMNYYLNFHRVFTESRPRKIAQLTALLRNLSDVVAPEHGLALYFLGYLQHKLEGRIDPAVVDRLRRRTETSGFWTDRMAAFGLSIDHLLTGAFPNRGETAELVPGSPAEGIPDSGGYQPPV